MNYLLDTHTFIWLDTDSTKLSQQARNAMAESDSVLLLSLVSVWEIQIKVQLGKLHLRMPLADIIHDQQEANRIRLLSITPDHVYELDNLPLHHRDPFDRLLVAQARIEQISILSADPKIAQYPVTVIW